MFNSTSIVTFEPSTGYDFKCVKNLFRCQVFTPCGRYALSAIYEGMGEVGIRYTRFYVVDLFEKKLHIYKYGDESVKSEWDCYYFINECQLVVIFCDETGFKQQIIQLCHVEKTLTIVGTRLFAYTVPIADTTLSHTPFLLPLCHYGITIKHKEEAVTFDISLEGRIFLIPKDPCSISNIKIFLTTLSIPNNHNNEAIEYYEAKNGVSSPYKYIAFAKDGCIYFPVASDGEVIMGVFLSIDIEKLVNVRNNEDIDLKELEKQQG